ncbi:MAG: AMIN domain-containing protein [Desulfomonile sp.]|nr:AMIN domain-containing protein [Desulfomonile sp.]
MRSIVGGCIPVLVLVMILAVNPPACGASGPGIITDVRVSRDLKRIVIHSQGDVPEPAVYKPTKPSTLVLDFGKAVPAQKLGRMKLAGNRIREIKIDRVGTGTRVTVDFGGHAVPPYRVRKIEDCFLVFLGEFKLSPESIAEGHVHRETSKVRQVGGSGSRWVAAPAASGPAKLMIKAAHAQGNEIEVDVADRRFPEKVYRIRLDVDLSSPALDAAEIIPLPQKERSASRGGR